VIKLADELREKKVKIGFFSSTPQGGVLIVFFAMSKVILTIVVHRWCCPGLLLIYK
jgi:hypothetical protein